MRLKTGTIRQIHHQLLQDGYQVSEYALRKWVHEGALPSVRSGKKYFVTFDHVVEFLTTGSVTRKPA